MDIGMLWFDNDKKTSIPSKVERAAQYYQKKYGKIPNLCYIHPKMVNGGNGRKGNSKQESNKDSLKVGGILVLKNEKILPDHFWIGISTRDEPLSSGV
jgi:hypothetical protein